ncbi:MAG: PASTA domain-containing protein [Acidobacteria bacterium]|nr:PASTA domain-containing protein [Acidobacteriota bacterium]
MGRLLTRRHANAPLAREAPADWRTGLRRRLGVAVALMALWTGGILARLVYLQVDQHADLMARAERQQRRTIASPAKRGDILDRHGRVLATSVDAGSIYAVPTEIEDPNAAVARLCAALEDCTAAERRALVERLGRSRAFAYVRRRISPDQAQRVAALDLDGIGFLEESRRFYPNRELAAHLIGYVGVDNNGLSGIESTYDAEIAGKAGTVLIHTDARRHAFARFERPPTTGATIELTVDQYLQHVAERELRDGVVENEAIGGTAIVMNPRTGEILALANEPTFNPNVYREAAQRERRNRAVQDLYEPGSTFKVVTASAALQERLMPVDTPIDVGGGRIRIGARVVSDTHDYGTLSFTDVIVKSSNVGAIKIGLRLGAQRMGEYVEKFGFGRRVSPDFPSENAGIVWPVDKLNDSALASVSMGYQVGVTPLQMAAAVGAIANGGEYVEPRVLRAVYRGDRRFEVAPKVLRRVVDASTAAQLTTIMEQVVERGTATAAKIAGFAIAGKTGTANKLIGGRYSSETFASFVGFLPADDPAITILVVLESPRGAHGRFGGPVSGPIFRRIAEAAIPYLGLKSSADPTPPVLVARRDPSGFSPAPTSGTPLAPAISFAADAPGTVPDLRGLSAREAVRRLTMAGLVPRARGDGFVASQEPPPGEPIEPGDVCTIVLERAAAAQSTSIARAQAAP